MIVKSVAHQVKILYIERKHNNETQSSGLFQFLVAVHEHRIANIARSEMLLGSLRCSQTKSSFDARSKENRDPLHARHTGAELNSQVNAIQCSPSRLSRTPWSLQEIEPEQGHGQRQEHEYENGHEHEHGL